jgi:hypothetical protein
LLIVVPALQTLILDWRRSSAATPQGHDPVRKPDTTFPDHACRRRINLVLVARVERSETRDLNVSCAIVPGFR